MSTTVDAPCCIDRLPIELVNTIFEFTLPETTFIKPAPHTAPLSLCAVSSRWRSIAVSNSLLWNSISLDIIWTPSGSSSILQSSSKVHLTQLWLARSAQSALSIQLRLRQAHIGDTDIRWAASSEPEALAAIVRDAVRWKRVEIALDADDSFIHLPKLSLSFHTPNLREASLRVHSGWEPTARAEQWIQDIAGVSECLEDLTWFGLHTLAPLALPPLRSLTLSFVPNDISSPDDLFRILSALPSLEYHHITACWQMPAYLTGPIHHHGIQTLTIDARKNMKALSPLLDVLAAPSLTRLTIVSSDLHGFSEVHCLTLSSFLCRSQPVQIHQLTLENISMEIEELDAYFAPCRGIIENLVIRGERSGSGRKKVEDAISTILGS